MRGRRIRVLDAGDPEASALEGVAHGIDADGALLVECEGGAIERVVAGDVTIAKEPRA
jgi:biotin-(acetyl-CoA carboxylase) ligase